MKLSGVTSGVKKRILTAVIALCAALTLMTPGVQAAGTVYFVGVNDTLVPLSDQTIPRYYGGELYLPYNIFTYKADDTGLGVFCAASSDLVMLYTSGRRLKFDMVGATVTDQDNILYNTYTAKAANGTVYLPAELIKSFFGLSINVISSEPATVIRIKSTSAVYNDPTFVGTYKNAMQTAYNAYLGITSSDAPSSTASVPPVIQSFENVTVYLSFHDFTADRLALLLDILDTAEFKCAFFVGANEIAENADLLRRAAGSGHAVGIRLDTGEYEEFRSASDLLFEAVKIKTLLVSSGGGVLPAAAETAGSKGLILCDAADAYGETSELTLATLTGSLSALGREGSVNLSFACSETSSTVMPGLLSYLSDHQYDVRRISETDRPPEVSAE